ncbi:coniferyl aldehyde dehydrogenase [Flexibacterium corallicola]|uniref:coniferyl aldehyde dehydrogenase n=1 Tax=Flexibacterium corallicola TaxID=3037259 RepID=UPI00286EFC18|nr:coniferyl aldehyde dehydrogenase [Pseudovibrio sp. M1P-2-3]
MNKQTAYKDEAQSVSSFSLEPIFQRQRSEFSRAPYASFEERKERLQKLRKVMLKNKGALIKALDEDFGGRSAIETQVAEFVPVLETFNYTLKKLRKWMAPSKRHVSLILQPASAKVMYQPLGVVGIVVPFNYPLMLSLSPLITALAAGNHVMLKMSEFTPATSALFADMIAKEFPPELITVVQGGPEIASEFSKLPFDHLVFTGSTPVGRHVMRAAADNLTPVTLELGGKSPTIIDSDADLKLAAERICFSKTMNAGQTCISPDYVLVTNDRRDAFIQEYKSAFQSMYPTIENNENYTAIINERHHTRITSLIDDAHAKGANIIRADDGKFAGDGTRRIAPHLIVDATDDMEVMQEEIFGPLLPIIGVDSLDEAIQFVKDRPRPLSLYYFGLDKQKQQQVLEQTHSGGVSINECLLHIAVDDMPFGGIGPSGMGHYHGPEGFLTFSKAKSVLTKGRFNSARLMQPPYTGWLKQSILKYLRIT